MDHDTLLQLVRQRLAGLFGSGMPPADAKPMPGVMSGTARPEDLMQIVPQDAVGPGAPIPGGPGGDMPPGGIPVPGAHQDIVAAMLAAKQQGLRGAAKKRSKSGDDMTPYRFNMPDVKVGDL